MVNVRNCSREISTHQGQSVSSSKHVSKLRGRQDIWNKDIALLIVKYTQSDNQLRYA